MTINPLNLLDRGGIEAHLRAGGAALLPTDTLPALASMPEQAAQIWRLKRRPQDKPLIQQIEGIVCHRLFLYWVLAIKSQDRCASAKRGMP